MGCLTHTPTPLPKVQDEKLENTTVQTEPKSWRLIASTQKMTLTLNHCIHYTEYLNSLHVHIIPASASIVSSSLVFVVVVFVFDSYKLKRYFHLQGFSKTFTKPPLRKSRMFPGNSLWSSNRYFPIVVLSVWVTIIATLWFIIGVVFIFSLCVTHQWQGVPIPSLCFFAFVCL